MELKTLDAKTARSNVSFYKMKLDLEAKEAKMKKIQLIFDCIDKASKKGLFSINLKVETFGGENLRCIYKLLKELGYSVEYHNGGGILRPYITINWDE